MGARAAAEDIRLRATMDSATRRVVAAVDGHRHHIRRRRARVEAIFAGSRSPAFERLAHESSDSGSIVSMRSARSISANSPSVPKIEGAVEDLGSRISQSSATKIGRTMRRRTSSRGSGEARREGVADQLREGRKAMPSRAVGGLGARERGPEDEARGKK